MTNGEKYKDPEERAKMFCKFCSSQGSCVNCQFNKVDAIPPACAFAWEELEYKEELLPCPFCGGDVMLNEEKSNDLTTYKFECPICFSTTYFGETSKEKAIESWNRRN